jgi:ADP-ribose pyrophosphatase
MPAAPPETEPRLRARLEHYANPRFTLADETWDTRDGAITRPVIHHPGAVALIAQPRPGALVLVRQFRYPVRHWTWEIPAGTRSPCESAEATAHRELREEAGLEADRLTECLRCYPAVGVSSEEMIIYRAEGLRAVAAAPEPGELISVVTADAAELAAMAADGRIRDAKTLLALVLIGVGLPASQGGHVPRNPPLPSAPSSPADHGIA